jgi:hypothetical protein
MRLSYSPEIAPYLGAHPQLVNALTAGNYSPWCWAERYGDYALFKIDCGPGVRARLSQLGEPSVTSRIIAHLADLAAIAEKKRLCVLG